MLQLNQIKENPGKIIERLRVKNFDAGALVEQILSLDSHRREFQKKLDDNLAESNRITKEIGGLLKQGKTDEADTIKERTADLKRQSKELSDELNKAATELQEVLIRLPNLPHESVPAGRSAEDNEVVHQEGIPPDLGPSALPHWDLGLKYKILDFETGSKVTGAGFPFYRGKGARLQRALINFFLERATEAGYEEYQPPLMINEASGYGTGQIPDKDSQMYFINLDNLYLIPTAEVPITNIYRDVILRPEDLPIRNVAYSACFRREAGSYGKDVRGLNRLHQFDKVEIVQVQHPDRSYEALEEMKNHVTMLVRALGLPFRIVRLCGGDMSFTSAMTYDFEVYSGAQKKWLEVSSVSNFEAFQANRMKLRIKDADGKTKLAHTLNGSALALPRIVAALLENNQTTSGIRIPEPLVRYTQFEMIN
jgi:seryl-tRNA synthetase